MIPGILHRDSFVPIKIFLLCLLGISAGFAASANAQAFPAAAFTVCIIGLGLGSFPAAVFLCFASLPFQTALNVLLDYDINAARIIIPALVALGIVYFRRWMPTDYQIKRIARIGVLFLISAGASLAFADEPFWGTRKMLFILTLAPLFILGIVTVRSLRRFEYSIFILPAAILSIMGIVQFFAQFETEALYLRHILHSLVIPFIRGESAGLIVQDYSSLTVNIGGSPVLRAVATFPDPHTFSAFLNAGYSYILAILFFEKKPLRFLTPILVILLLCVAAALFLTFARSGYLGFVASTVFFIVLWIRKQKKGKISADIKRKAAALFIVAMLCAVALPSLFQERIMESFSSFDSSGTERIYIWQDSLRIFGSHIATGVGLGNFSHALFPEAPYRSPINSHNTYLEFAAELGIIGIGLFLAFLAAIGIALWKCARGGEHTQPLIAAALGSLAWFAVQNFFETGVYDQVSLGTLLFMWGAGLGYIQINNKEPKPMTEYTI